MSVSRQQIFRASALRHYMHNQEKSSYLRFIPLPIALLLWMLLGLFIFAGYMAWNEEIPTYVNASGLVVTTAPAKAPVKGRMPDTRAVLFLPLTQVATVHVGMPVRLYVGGSARSFVSRITTIAAETRSPADIHAQYEHANCSLLVTQPVTEITVTLPGDAKKFNGSLLAAQITVGSRRLLSLLPGIGDFFAK